MCKNYVGMECEFLIFRMLTEIVVIEEFLGDIRSESNGDTTL